MLKTIITYLFGEIRNEDVEHIDLPDGIEYSQEFINWFKTINRL